MVNYYPLTQGSIPEGLSFGKRSKFREGFLLTEMGAEVLKTSVNVKMLEVTNLKNRKYVAFMGGKISKTPKTKLVPVERLAYVLGVINGPQGMTYPKSLSKLFTPNECVFLLKYCELTEQQLLNFLIKVKNKPRRFPPFHMPIIAERTDLTPRIIEKMVTQGEQKTLGRLLVNPTIPDETKTMITLMGTALMPDIVEEPLPVTDYHSLEEAWTDVVNNTSETRARMAWGIE